MKILKQKAETRKQKKWKQETGSGKPEKIVRELREFLELGRGKKHMSSRMSGSYWHMVKDLTK